MSDEKRSMLVLDPPIPTYEETIASQAQSDVGDHTTAETSQLLGERRGGTRGYRPPTVESERGSLESSFLEDYASSRESQDALEREIEQMEILDPGESEHSGDRGPGGLRQNISKHLSSITSSLSSISLPHSWRVNLFKCFPRIRIPDIPCFRSGLIPVYRFLGVVFGLIVIYTLLATDAVNMNTGNVAGGLVSFDPEVLRQYVKDTVDKEKIEHYLKYLTSFDHLAGTQGDLVLAKWVEREFKSFGLEGVELMEYYAYLNYPKPGGRKVAIVDPPWEALLEEPKIHSKENTFVFHGHSKSGTATGPLIYANYGSRDDFAALEKQGINLAGAIVLVRYGGTQPDIALKVKAAQDKGAAGCIIFSDPKTEGFSWPESAVQRGSVSLTSWLVGDVLTPGYAAVQGAERIKQEDSVGLLKIPSLPLSWNDAQHLLKSLKGHGKKVEESWEAAGNSFHEEIWTGDIDTSPKVRLDNYQEEVEKQPIFNVLGLIKGYDDHKKRITVGNHRDAWCFGASDPNSGTSIMLEVARIFGQMVEVGWKPSRSIIFASWDAKEYNLIGSTEYVEDNIESLRLHGMAYINLDAAIAGTEFSASASPLLQTALMNVLERVEDPNTNETLRTLWGDKELPGLGAGGDYVAWQDYAGVSSVDMGFIGGEYPYHSCYDNFEWMKDRGDSGFTYHKAMAQVLALLILELADSPQLPFNMTNYAVALDRYTNDLEGFINKKIKVLSSGEAHVDLTKLREAVVMAHERLNEFDSKHEPWMDQVGGTVMGGLDNYGTIYRNSRNARMSNFEEHLLDLEEGGGLPGRQWFKHVVFAPEAWNGYEPGYFPGIRDAVENGDWELAQKQVEKVAKRIDRASWKLLN